MGYRYQKEALIAIPLMKCIPPPGFRICLNPESLDPPPYRALLMRGMPLNAPFDTDKWFTTVMKGSVLFKGLCPIQWLSMGETLT